MVPAAETYAGFLFKVLMQKPLSWLVRRPACIRDPYHGAQHNSAKQYRGNQSAMMMEVAARYSRACMKVKSQKRFP